MKNLRLFLITIVCGFLAVDPAFGASKKKPTPPPIHTPTIASVTADSITVTEAKTTKTLGITQFTEITVNGQKATAAELKAGMGVNVTLGTDPTKAARINATGK
ncbi:MAG TPA: hypothetical protein VM940_13785 [Chthoniobacterales bacterium]|jgi:hypothetical protein|nr:hypothetical protein [Chthoniobacterales bacterium]